MHQYEFVVAKHSPSVYERYLAPSFFVGRLYGTCSGSCMFDTYDDGWLSFDVMVEMRKKGATAIPKSHV